MRSVLRANGVAVPVRIVHARAAKEQRAVPVAAWTEAGALRFAGSFSEMEEELEGSTLSGWEGPDRVSSDRANAMIWPATALLGGRGRGGPRVSGL